MIEFLEKFNRDLIKGLFKNKQSLQGKRIGCEELDSVFRPNNGLMVLTSGYSQGKTLFSRFYVVLDAVNNGNKSLIYEYEGDKRERFYMYDTMITNCHSTKEPSVIEDDYLLWGKPHGKSIDTILEEIKVAKDTYGIKNVLIDPFTCITNRIGGISDPSKLTEAMKRLKGFAEEQDLLIILTCQQERPFTSSGTRFPLSLENIYAGYPIYQEADYVLGLERVDWLESRIHFKVLKSNNFLKAEELAEFDLKYNEDTMLLEKAPTLDEEREQLPYKIFKQFKAKK